MTAGDGGIRSRRRALGRPPVERSPRSRSGPVVGVGAVVLCQGRVLLVRRDKAPLRGRWAIPGGTVELGETLLEALVREVKEETDLTVRPMEVLTVFDHIDRDAGGGVLRHFVIVDYLCEYVGGEVRAGSDAEAAVFAAREELPAYDLPAKALEVVEDAYGRRAGTPKGRLGVARPPALTVPSVPAGQLRSGRAARPDRRKEGE